MTQAAITPKTWLRLTLAMVCAVLIACGAKPTGVFRFEVNSVNPVDRYAYPDGAEHKTVSASPGFSLAVLTFTATNDTNVTQRFSTEDKWSWTRTGLL